MANKKVEIALILKDKFSKELKEADSGFNKLTKTLGGLKGVIGGLVAAGGIYKLVNFMKDTTKAAMEQEEADFALAEALKNVGYYSDETFKKLTDLASALQMTTTYGDETIESIEALFLRFNIAPELLEKAVQATMDYARAVGKDLRTAALDMAKAAEGNLMMLQRYGVRIDKATFETKGFVAILDEVEKKFGGAEAAYAGTFAGQLLKLKNLIGDVKEEFGNAIIKSEGWRKALAMLQAILVTFLQTAKTDMADLADAMSTLGEAFYGMLKVGYEAAAFMKGYIQSGGDFIDATTEQIIAVGKLEANFEKFKAQLDEVAKRLRESESAQVQLNRAMSENLSFIIPTVEVQAKLQKNWTNLSFIVDDFQVNFKDMTIDYVNRLRVMQDAIRGLAEVFVENVLFMRGNFKEAIEDMIKQLAVFIVKETIAAAIIKSIQGPGAVAGTVGGSILDLLGFKEGGVVHGFKPLIGAFQEGGVVTRPTLALVGEGREKEYIIPESKFPKPEVYVTVHNANPDTYVEVFTKWSPTGRQKFYREVIKPAQMETEL